MTKAARIPREVGRFVEIHSSVYRSALPRYSAVTLLHVWAVVTNSLIERRPRRFVGLAAVEVRTTISHLKGAEHERRSNV
jgi:hypothetical protein